MIFMTPLIKYNLRFERRSAKVRTRSAVGELFRKKSSPTATLDSNVLVNTFKLVGNSIYGKAATNKETQTDAVYANGFSATYLANLQETRSSSTPRRLHTRLREAQHAAVCAPVYAKVSASGHVRNRSNGHKFLLLRGDDTDARHLHQV